MLIYKLYCFPLFKKKMEHISPFCWATDAACFGLPVTYALDFNTRVDLILHAFLPMWSSVSPLVRHLLTAQKSAWQLNFFNPNTYRHVCKHWWRFGPGLEPTTICAASTTLGTTRPLRFWSVWNCLCYLWIRLPKAICAKIIRY